MRILLALLVFLGASAFAQTIIPRVGFRDAIIVRVQQIDRDVRIERRDDLSFAIGPALTLVSLEAAYQQYAAAPGTLGIVIEQVSRDAIATVRRASRASQPAPNRLPQPQAPPQRRFMPEPEAEQPRQPALPLGAQPLEIQRPEPTRATPQFTSIIRPRASLAGLEPAPVSRPFLGDLVEVLAGDGEPMAPERLAELNLTSEEVWTSARRNARIGRFAASPLERYGAVARLTGSTALLLDPGICGTSDQGNRLFLLLGPSALATADRRTPGAEADFFRLVRDVAQTAGAYSRTPVTCRAGVWEIARQG